MLFSESSYQHQSSENTGIQAIKDSLYSKPFSPGEAHSVDFLFDTLKGIKADNFIIEDEKFKPIVFKL
ncbi:MAG: hypothetical protein V7K88_20865 [Nostoc sp.]